MQARDLPDSVPECDSHADANTDAPRECDNGLDHNLHGRARAEAWQLLGTAYQILSQMTSPLRLALLHLLEVMI